MEKLNLNDEASFVLYCEQFVLDIERLLRAKPELHHVPLLNMSMQLEELIHKKVLEENGMSTNENVWNDRNAIMFYSESKERLLRSLESKELSNWKKMYDDNKNNPIKLLNELIKTDEKRVMKSSIEPKKIVNTISKKNKLGGIRKKSINFEPIPSSSIPKPSITTTIMDEIQDNTTNFMDTSIIQDSVDDFALFNLDLSDSLLGDTKPSDDIKITSAWNIKNDNSMSDSTSNISKQIELNLNQEFKKIQDDLALRKELEELEKQKTLESLKVMRTSNTAANPIDNKSENKEVNERKLQIEKLEKERELERKNRELEEQAIQKKLQEQLGMDTLDDEDWL